MQVARCKTHNMATNYNCQMLGELVVVAFVNVAALQLMFLLLVAIVVVLVAAIVVVVVAVVRAIIRPIGIDEAITPTDH